MGKNKYLMLAIAVICFGLLLVGGTYAFVTFTATVTNSKIDATSTCFIIDYDTGDAITGTLFQSSTAQGGLTGTVKLNINEECSVAANGTITLNVGTETSSVLLSEGALKYAVFEAIDEQPVSTGTITKTGDINIYTGFTLPNKYAKSYYIYVWLDGAIADNDYIDVTFSGSIKASAMQTEECVITYATEGNAVWTEKIDSVQDFALPDSSHGFACYYLNGDNTSCDSVGYAAGASVTTSCGMTYLATTAKCSAVPC